LGPKSSDEVMVDGIGHGAQADVRSTAEQLEICCVRTPSSSPLIGPLLLLASHALPSKSGERWPSALRMAFLKVCEV
jgi:hypothetical protein